jgi:hypothetical protein
MKSDLFKNIFSNKSSCDINGCGKCSLQPFLWLLFMLIVWLAG